MSTTLVTGATGFTGSNLCRRLVDDGERVVAWVRDTSETGLLDALGVECRRVDICDPDAVRDALRDFDTVYHIAAAFRVEHVNSDVFQRVNVEATGNILAAAREDGVRRFVHCSTVGVQGGINNPPATEEYPYDPGDHYQESKLQGELLALEASADGLPLTVVRPAGIYGPGDMRFLKLFRSISRRRFVMIGSGEVLYHLTYIDDLVDGIVRAGRRPEAVGEVFTLAGPRVTTLRELVDGIADAVGVRRLRLRLPYAPVHAAAVACEKACKLIGMAPPLYPRRVEFFVKDRAFDISKARRLLGYDPQVDVDEGLHRTAEWYRQQGLI
ncbi:MAG: NAD-dependent epimerase/dehydratase family protein [Acidobacteriota bacterium]|jgi:nucleoside-diphosphate-sugar epimerase